MKKKRNTSSVHCGEHQIKRYVIRLIPPFLEWSSWFPLSNLSFLSQSPPVPYKSIMTSLPFYAILFAHMGQNYGYETLMTELPTYMKQVLRFSLKEVSAAQQFNLHIRNSTVFTFSILHSLVHINRMVHCQHSHIWLCGFFRWVFRWWPIGWSTRIASRTRLREKLSTAWVSINVACY